MAYNPNNNFYGQNNNQMMNQLLRQRENIDNLINQYSQPLFTQPQAPVQNIINTNSTPSVEMEAKYLKSGESVNDILINNKTLFIDEEHSKIYIKDVNGSIIKNYDIVIPKDAKDLKIEELESKLKELEAKVNVKFTEPIRSTNNVEQSDANDNQSVKSTTTTVIRTNSKSTEGKTGGVHSGTV